MSRLIDAGVLLDKVLRFYTDQEKIGNFQFVACEIKQTFADMIIDAPTIEAELIRHGRWELHGNDDDCGCSYFCSECHKSYDEDWFYTNGEYTPFKCCPNCIAKMDGNQ